MKLGKAIKNEWKAELANFWALAMLYIGAYLVGTLINLVIAAITEETQYVSLGLIFAGIVLGITVFIIGAQMVQGFNLAVGMSVSRKNFLISYYVVNYVLCLASFAVVALLYFIDINAVKLIAPAYEYMLDIGEIGALNYILVAVISSAFLVTLASLFAAVIHKWGKKAFWVLWALWMILCLGVPRVLVNWETNAVGRFLHDSFFFIIGLPLWGLAAGGIAILVCLTGIVLLIMRKEPVQL